MEGGAVECEIDYSDMHDYAAVAAVMLLGKLQQEAVPIA